MSHKEFESKAIDCLLALIGRPAKMGDWYPLESSWHAERAMWVAKVESLIAEIARLQAKICEPSRDPKD